MKRGTRVTKMRDMRNMSNLKNMKTLIGVLNEQKSLANQEINYIYINNNDVRPRRHLFPFSEYRVYHGSSTNLTNG